MQRLARKCERHHHEVAPCADVRSDEAVGTRDNANPQKSTAQEEKVDPILVRNHTVTSRTVIEWLLSWSFKDSVDTDGQRSRHAESITLRGPAPPSENIGAHRERPDPAVGPSPSRATRAIAFSELTRTDRSGCRNVTHRTDHARVGRSGIRPGPCGIRVRRLAGRMRAPVRRLGARGRWARAGCGRGASSGRAWRSGGEGLCGGCGSARCPSRGLMRPPMLTVRAEGDATGGADAGGQVVLAEGDLEGEGDVQAGGGEGHEEHDRGRCVDHSSDGGDRSR